METTEPRIIPHKTNNFFALGGLYCGEPWWGEAILGEGEQHSPHIAFPTKVLHSKDLLRQKNYSLPYLPGGTTCVYMYIAYRIWG